MLIPSKHPQSLSEIVRSSIHHWRSTLKTIHHFIGVLIAVKTLLFILFLRLTQSAAQQNEASGLIALLVLVGLLSAYLVGCCFFSVFAEGVGKPLTSSQVFKIVRQRALFYLSVWLICTMLSMFGALFFLVPGIVLYIYTQYAKLLALFDKTNVIDSLVISLRLVARHWWRVFAIEAFIILISFAAVLMGQLAESVIVMPLSAVMGESSLSQLILQGIGTVLSITVVQLITVPLIVNLHILQLYDLKCRYQALSNSNSHRSKEDEETIVC